MAKPRVFISSTFYDLRQIRENIERFIKELGYEPVRHETGAIPYEKDKALEKSAYKEVEVSDIIVSVLGGRFGTTSEEDERFSITHTEIQKALNRGVQVYIFVEQAVLSEFDTYKLNKESVDIKYSAVDDIRIYEFLEKLFSLKLNNPISEFQTSDNIIDFLKAQWAGLFQRYLEKNQFAREMLALEELQATAKTLKELVEYVSKEGEDKDIAIKSILMSNHPAFKAFADATSTSYRIFFSNLSELNDWLSARSYEPVKPDEYFKKGVYEWTNHNKSEYLILTKEIFEKDGNLKIFTDKDWDKKWLRTEESLETVDEDDMPF